jgi:hypothetical protein
MLWCDGRTHAERAEDFNENVYREALCVLCGLVVKSCVIVENAAIGA